MERGYVKLWRKSLDTAVFKNPNLWMFWCWCLMKATHKQREQIIGFQKVDLLPGQFVFGRDKASEETGLSVQTVRTCLKTLEKLQNLTIKVTNKFSVITIINWDIYQPEKQEINQQPNQQVTINQPTSNHKQECKECKALNNKNPLYEYLISKCQNGFIPYQDKIIEFFKYRQSLPKAKQYKTEKGIDGLFRDITECQKQNLPVLECLDITMEKSWLTPSPQYFEKMTFLKNKQSEPIKHPTLDSLLS